jgi:hypothetical protein
MITRFDMNGRDVTDLPDLWSKDDFEVLTTQFSDPEQTSGLHANSPLSYFGRRVGGKWKHIDRRSRAAAVLCVLNHPLYFADQEERESK